jgi:transposase-like protein
MESKIKNKVVKCPYCKHPHKYKEIQFPSINDTGFWEVRCGGCEESFGMEVKNPQESSMSPNYLVIERSFNRIDGIEYASDTAVSSVNMNSLSLTFNYESQSIFNCPSCGDNLERRAFSVLTNDLINIRQAYQRAVDFLMSKSIDIKFLVVNVPFTCKCNKDKIATFYCDFCYSGNIQKNAEDYLLANIKSTNLDESIDGLFSKTDVMGFLEKLLIRWNLLASKIVIACPFVGHQYLKKEDKMGVWTWLLEMLNPDKTNFITRSATFTSYKSVLEDVQGLNHKLLAEYGLENRVVESNNKKQDFHAKFYAAVIDGNVEVMSGSANLVSGPSIENITFKKYKEDDFIRKYLQPLRVRTDHALATEYHWVSLKKNASGKYDGSDAHGNISSLLD